MELELNVTIKARCVRCKRLRDAPRESTRTLQWSESDDSSVTVDCIVVTPTACRCGESRVRVTAELDFG